MLCIYIELDILIYIICVENEMIYVKYHHNSSLNNINITINFVTGIRENAYTDIGIIL